MRAETAPQTSPFYARAYGGFTKDQGVFFREHLLSVRGSVIMDPMGGQGFALSHLATEHAEVWIGDLNPAPLLLASLRDPSLIAGAHEVAKYLTEWLKPFKRRRRKSNRLKYFEAWISPAITSDLSEYASKLGLGLFDQGPFRIDGTFWSLPPELRVAAALPVLAARELACFRVSDNVTWLKPGGLAREEGIQGALVRALKNWVSYTENARRTTTLSGPNDGSVNVQRMDVERGLFGRSPLVDAVITSPPYANRLDYTRMWAPEVEILAAMSGGSSEELKTQQIGSTVVSRLARQLDGEVELPQFIRSVLGEIRRDGSKYSESYYYPFFRNYANSLQRSFGNIAKRIKPGGTMVVFVRDTARKDVLFPSGKLVIAALKKSGATLVTKEKRVIRGHIGLLRKSSRASVYGLAQQEWWLAFRIGAK